MDMPTRQASVNCIDRMKKQISAKNHQTIIILFVENGCKNFPIDKEDLFCLCQRKVETQPSMINVKSMHKNLFQHGKRQYTWKGQRYVRVGEINKGN